MLTSTFSLISQARIQDQVQIQLVLPQVELVFRLESAPNVCVNIHDFYAFSCVLPVLGYNLMVLS